MAASEMGILGLARIAEIFDAVQDRRQVPTNLTFVNRINKVPATDADIIARFLEQGHIADIIGYDQKASTYSAARIKFEANLIPKIKIGRTLTEEDIRRLKVLETDGPATVEGDAFEEYFTRLAARLLTDVAWREESMIIGMEIDTFSYNHNGMQLAINWGMPSVFKVTVTNAWTDTVNATPVRDILNQRLVIETIYGKRYNRIKMSTAAFNLIPKTQEFQGQVRNFYLNVGQPTPTIPYQSTAALQNLVGAIMDMKIELYDARYPVHQNSGAAPVYVPFLPLNTVILDSTENDNNNDVKDFANGIVPETVVGDVDMGRQVAASSAFTAAGARYGPVAYVTRPPDLNPPTLTWWVSEAGMPRKKDEAMTSVLNVGTVTDFIPAGISF